MGRSTELLLRRRARERAAREATRAADTPEEAPEAAEDDDGPEGADVGATEDANALAREAFAFEDEGFPDDGEDEEEAE